MTLRTQLTAAAALAAGVAAPAMEKLDLFTASMPNPLGPGSLSGVSLLAVPPHATGKLPLHPGVLLAWSGWRPKTGGASIIQRKSLECEPSTPPHPTPISLTAGSVASGGKTWGVVSAPLKGLLDPPTGVSYGGPQAVWLPDSHKIVMILGNGTSGPLGKGGCDLGEEGLLGPLAVTSTDLGEHWGPVINVRQQLLKAGWCAPPRPSASEPRTCAPADPGACGGVAVSRVWTR